MRINQRSKDGKLKENSQMEKEKGAEFLLVSYWRKIYIHVGINKI